MMESDRSHIRAGFIFIGICIAIGVGLFLVTRPSAVEQPMQNLAEAENLIGPEAEPVEPETTANSDASMSAPADDGAEEGAVLPLRSASLVGTWGPASLNPSANPDASCDTDNVVTFNSDGSYQDGGGYGRFRVDGNQIVYFNRVLIDFAEGTEDQSEINTPLRTTAELRDENTLKEDDALLHRCITR